MGMTPQYAEQQILEFEEEIAELRATSERLREKMLTFFPNEVSRCEAYGVFDFAWSGNPYDITLESIMPGLRETYANQEEEE